MRVFPRDELGRVFGLFGPLMAVSSISGPVLEGFLLWLDPFGLDCNDLPTGTLAEMISTQATELLGLLGVTAERPFSCYSKVF